MTRRFWISAALTLPLLVLAMADMAGGRTIAVVPHAVRPWIELALATPVCLVGRVAVLRARRGVGRDAPASTCSR